MSQHWNGMSASSLDVSWIKSRKSAANGQCVELAALPAGKVAMRNSTDPAGPALVFSALELESFLDGARNGEFDYVVTAN
ncbi:DUF397 domain-containing protein [Streptomyces sp. NPDC002851]